MKLRQVNQNLNLLNHSGIDLVRHKQWTALSNSSSELRNVHPHYNFIEAALVNLDLDQSNIILDSDIVFKNENPS